MEAIMDSMDLLCGGRAALKQEPHLCTIVNTKSPLQLDAAMTEVLFTEYPRMLKQYEPPQWDRNKLARIKTSSLKPGSMNICCLPLKICKPTAESI